MTTLLTTKKATITSSLLAAAVLCVSANTSHAATEIYEDSNSYSSSPTHSSIAADVAFGRPLQGVVAVAGAVVWAVTLPLTAISGDYHKTADTLFIKPADAFFKRCLGCTPEQDATHRLSQEGLEIQHNGNFYKKNSAMRQQVQSNNVVVHPYQQ